jgi:hypothetical protein
MELKEVGLAPEALAEMRGLYENNGMLTPEAVLAAASKPNSALHGAFEWDDSEAARKYRLEQARDLIQKVKVQIISSDEKITYVRAYVSLPSDREGNGGYRSTVKVLSDAEQRAELISLALKELATFRKKYAELSELAAVFEAIEQMDKKNVA